MKSRHILACSLFVVVTLCASAQTTATKGERPGAKAADSPKGAEPADAAKPATPPDQVAFAAARKIEAPLEKIAALKDILAKYPKSKIEAGIRAEIFRSTIKAAPDNKKLVMSTADAVIKATPKAYHRYSNNDVATALLLARVYLPEASKYAKKSLAAYKQKEFYAERRAQAAKGKRNPPPDAELLSAYNQARGSPLQTLGLLAIQTGHVEEGRQMLFEVLATQPMAIGANVALAELAEKNGDEAKSLDHLLIAKLSGRIPENALANLKRLYTKKHGSLDTLEATLDRIYNARFPSPIHVKPYECKPERSTRVVLAEFFTGAGCPPCVAADLALDAVLERYSRDELAVMVYHQHIPAPDPMAFPTTWKRFEFYQRNSVPTYVIDGDKDGGGGAREAAQNTYETINTKIEKRLNEPTIAEIDLEAVRNGENVVVKVAVQPITGDERDLRLHVMLVEESIRYSGENGIRFHAMVVRAIAGPDTAEGFKLEIGKKYQGEPSFEIPAIVTALKAHLDDYEINANRGKVKFAQKLHEIEMDHLAVIAFVQDARSNAVLQSKFAKVGAQTSTR
jgi:hypothetical protein